ncbi:hypothetical protein AV530_014627 [Patagioenas fasciata monilis]|uniref:Uncharacterized protein n=1 Tax=Patagioenas fasciata monilis TaxID=372326 RepID=A0A1V4KB57_PATFA|nr:hypothetical protein AV530_014627 [Patagioenas fasciata monilis]
MLPSHLNVSQFSQAHYGFDFKRMFEVLWRLRVGRSVEKLRQCNFFTRQLLVLLAVGVRDRVTVAMGHLAIGRELACVSDPTNKSTPGQ